MTDGSEDIFSCQMYIWNTAAGRNKGTTKDFSKLRQIEVLLIGRHSHFKRANQIVISNNFFLTQETQFEGMIQSLNDITHSSRYYITAVVRAAKWKAAFTLQLEASQSRLHVPPV